MYDGNGEDINYGSIRFRIDGIQAVPGPGSLTLMGCAGVPVAAAWRSLRRMRRPSSGARRGSRLPIATKALARFAASIVGILVVSTSASGGIIFQTVSSLLPGGFGVNQMDVSVSLLKPSILVQPNGDDSYSHVVLDGPNGTATLNGHACSGGAFGGDAGSNGLLSYNSSYLITSATLPGGSLVYLSLVADAARQETVRLDVPKGSEHIFDTSGVSGDARISFALPDASYSFSGTFNHGKTPFDLQYMTKAGLFDGQDSRQLLTVVGGSVHHGVVAAHVGDFINVGVAAQLIAGSGAFSTVTADADAQMTLNWGIQPFDSQVEIVSLGGERAPDNNDLSLFDVIAGLPPRPSTVAAVPEPTTVLLLGQAIVAGSCGAWWRRRHYRPGPDVRSPRLARSRRPDRCPGRSLDDRQEIRAGACR